ncbi:tetratricopeptide repeat-containing sensor histidine kinase [Arthrospiribacter ruber]|uniref:Signal transduction histidine kinase internal region domain-containing protein n=1 Tax=Arthrospiribacter ruber TaxID=2487934 RepID=A0A951J1F6_9BACT|nr:tetratricopeptide repeat protein [Arthrospiribacter ruber]MBW3469487.1 hypothetical protein [Arthrospiribacter ruber]
MKTLKVLPVFLFYSLQVTCQTDFLDSLSHLLFDKNLKDSTKVDIYNDLSYDWSGSDPKKGLLYADSAIWLAGKISDERRKYAAINSKGVNYWMKGEDSMALESFREVMKYHQSQSNELGEGRMLNNMALLLYNKADYRTALDYHNRANQIFEKQGITNYLINGLSNSGVVYLALADYPRALETFLKALSLTDSTMLNESAKLHTNIGLVYKNLNELTEGEKFQRKAITYYQKLKQRQGLASEYGNLASNLQNQGRLDEAEALYMQALEINREIGNERRIASDLANFGKHQQLKGDLEKANEFLGEAIERFSKIDDVLNLAAVYLDQAEVWKQQNKPISQILEIQKKALEFGQKSGSLIRQNEAWKAISETYTVAGQSQNALEAFHNYVLFKDSVFNDQNQKDIMKMQIQFDYDMKAQQMESDFLLNASLLEAKNEKQKIISIVAIFLFLLFIIFGAIIQHFRSKKNLLEKEKLEAEFNAQKAILEQKALKAQMNPHFIFNAMNSISNFLLKNEPEKADFYLNKFARLIRRILEMSEEELISLEEELDVLKDYIDIESLRLGKAIELQVNLDERLDPKLVKIPPLLIQPMIENSIWHGIANTPEEGQIKISVFQNNGLLKLTVKDNGNSRAEIPSQNPEKKKSMGLGIIQGRLKILLGDKSPDIKWQKLSNGSEVALHLPILS